MNDQLAVQQATKEFLQEEIILKFADGEGVFTCQGVNFPCFLT